VWSAAAAVAAAAATVAEAVVAAGRVFVGTLAIPDPPTALNTAPLTGVKVAALRTMPLGRLKAAAARLPGRPTINDLVAAALAGALRAHLANGGAARLPSRLHVGMPFSLHPPGVGAAPAATAATAAAAAAAGGLLSNTFALLSAALPVGAPTPAARLAAATAAFRALKRGAEPALTVAAFRLLGLLPSRLRGVVWARLTRRVSLTFSNVPGPVRAVAVAGRPVTGIACLVPTAGSVGASVGVFSYDGCVTLGVYGDAAVLPRGAEGLADALVRELDALCVLGETGEEGGRGAIAKKDRSRGLRRPGSRGATRWKAAWRKAERQSLSPEASSVSSGGESEE